MASRNAPRESTGRRPERAKPAPPPPKRSAGQSALEWTRSLVVAVILFLIIRSFLVQTFTITSGSMIPTLLVGDWLMISKVTYGPQIPFTHARIPGYRSPRLNDIVVNRHGGSLSVRSAAGQGACFRMELPLGTSRDGSEV